MNKCREIFRRCLSLFGYVTINDTINDTINEDKVNKQKKKNKMCLLSNSYG